MNKTKIDWTDLSWNPVTGCLHGCDYCYARRMAKRLAGRAGYPQDKPFQPTFHEDKIYQPLHKKKPSKIFVCSMGELFGWWVDETWQNRVMWTIRMAPQHTFLLLTKDPATLAAYSGSAYHSNVPPLPSNLWVGASIESRAALQRLSNLQLVNHPNKFISFEPLLGDVTKDPFFNLHGIGWIIIGSMTGPGATRANVFDAYNLCKAARAAGIPVFVKENMDDLWSRGDPPKEFPVGFP